MLCVLLKMQLISPFSYPLFLFCTFWFLLGNWKKTKWKQTTDETGTSCECFICTSVHKQCFFSHVLSYSMCIYMYRNSTYCTHTLRNMRRLFFQCSAVNQCVAFSGTFLINMTSVWCQAVSTSAEVLLNRAWQKDKQITTTSLRENLKSVHSFHLSEHKVQRV